MRDSHPRQRIVERGETHACVGLAGIGIRRKQHHVPAAVQRQRLAREVDDDLAGARVLYEILQLAARVARLAEDLIEVFPRGVMTSHDALIVSPGYRANSS